MVAVVFCAFILSAFVFGHFDSKYKIARVETSIVNRNNAEITRILELLEKKELSVEAEINRRVKGLVEAALIEERLRANESWLIKQGLGRG
jgi:hypothetical protein